MVSGQTKLLLTDYLTTLLGLYHVQDTFTDGSEAPLISSMRIIHVNFATYLGQAPAKVLVPHKTTKRQRLVRRRHCTILSTL